MPMTSSHFTVAESAAAEPRLTSNVAKITLIVGNARMCSLLV